MRKPIIASFVAFALGCVSTEDPLDNVPLLGGGAAPAAPLCVIKDATTVPPAVDLPPLFPNAQMVIGSMQQWLGMQCPIVMPGSNVIADDVTCELRTKVTGQKAVGVTSRPRGLESIQTQVLASKNTYKRMNGTVIAVVERGPYPAPSTKVDCIVSCAGTIDGTLATATIVSEKANNPAGVLPPGFCKELLQTKFVANAIDCSLTAAQPAWEAAPIAIANDSTWKKAGGEETITGTVDCTPQDKIDYEGCAKVAFEQRVQRWVHDSEADDAVCGAQVTDAQKTDACKTNAPASASAKYTVSGGVCILKNADNNMDAPLLSSEL